MSNSLETDRDLTQPRFDNNTAEGSLFWAHVRRFTRPTNGTHLFDARSFVMHVTHDTRIRVLPCGLAKPESQRCVAVFHGKSRKSSGKSSLFVGNTNRKIAHARENRNALAVEIRSQSPLTCRSESRMQLNTKTNRITSRSYG